MAQTIQLANHTEISVSDNDLQFEIVGNQIHFSFAGIHNKTFTDREVLFQMPFLYEQGATVIGDGFQMLAQTSGTISQPIDIGRCPDNNNSYRIYPESTPKRYYNYLVVEDSAGYTLFGFTTCRRFAGYFEVKQHGEHWVLSAAIDGERTQVADWEHNHLESVVVLRGSSLSELYQEYSEMIAEHHPARNGVMQDAPVGWCSWYAYYADVTEGNVLENVECMQDNLAELEWVLLDDGYQAFMGDWLTPSDKFSGGVKELIHNIRAKGKKPAIWMAPFIAQPESEIFKKHPDWFVRHEDGELLKAEDVTYGGWRCTPWYILDTSNPEVQDHLTHVVSVMREEWGVELFKLDANYWGTLKGKRSQSGVTGVEAYRMGMEAIAKGAGDAWLLGCNAPMWPSLGLVDAMRVSDDVERHSHRFEQIAKETFFRSWQHRKLWQIDPDCATFTSLPNQAASREDYQFHRNVLLACGGLLLSGDPLPEITPFASKTLAKLMLRQRRNQESAKFTALGLNHAFLPLTSKNDLHCLFNYANDDATEFTLTADQPTDWYDYWTGEKLNQEPCQLLLVSLDKGLNAKAVVTAM
ncbi:alpha-galactosidase [Vibrio harveyi]|uniref:glycoside hydrolase family 36 protein n=1 Tax=Vibrio harveyi TaxID=669 RepID=UPI0023800D36|nr:alpha-galactosidase [Vibrio harveyi]EKO3800651.1 alpha-galactosidase [Vibrio harveyi]EKO3802835.1 alpha-galactosidase [Vibrio harveyi]ELH4834491.1 alpha-galactosidase [Vibrio harveyi]HDM8186795.1 alpha-galactosidase [Vibrio harveyi]